MPHPARPHSNSYWVAPRLLAGEYPAAKEAEAARAKLQSCLDGGVTCFIDLTEADEGLRPYAPLLPPNILHLRFPIRDVSVPASAAQMVEILDTIDAQLAEGHTLYVHCWGGIGRTGTVIGCYLARHGYQGEAALRELHRLWQACAKSATHASPETEAQRQWVRAWRG